MGAASIYNTNSRNPWFRNENFSVAKDFSFTESVKLRYIADFINIFNRTDFGGINGTIGNANFGRAAAVQDGGRIVSIRLRVEF